MANRFKGITWKIKTGKQDSFLWIFEGRKKGPSDLAPRPSIKVLVCHGDQQGMGRNIWRFSITQWLQKILSKTKWKFWTKEKTPTFHIHIISCHMVAVLNELVNCWCRFERKGHHACEAEQVCFIHSRFCHTINYIREHTKQKADSSKSSQYSFLSYPSACFGKWNTLVTFLANYLNTSNNTYIHLYIIIYWINQQEMVFFKVIIFFQLQKKTLFSESSPLVVVENPKETIQNALPNTSNLPWLVGGWTNPIEKYARQNGNLPEIWVKIKKYLKPPPG